MTWDTFLGWYRYAMMVLLAICVVSCVSLPERPAAPPAEAPPGTAADPAALGDATPSDGLSVEDLRAAVDRTAAAFAASKSMLASREAAIAAAARAAEERLLRAWLLRVQVAGIVLASLGTLALALTWSPWASWIPGGRPTACAAIAGGVMVVIVARVLGLILSLAWLAWVALALAVVGVLAALAWVAIRETAAHADRVAPATTDDDRKAAGKVSAAAQARAGVRGLINLIRPRANP